MRKRLLLLSLAACWPLFGCASMKTTFFTRHEDDTLCKENHHPINGVPVMVKVPTHLEIKVREVVHIHQYETDLKVLNCGNRTIRKVDTDLRFTEKMFVVDPKRPFSGSGAFGFEFKGSTSDGSRNASSGHGHLNKVGYKAEDETITNAVALLAEVVPMLTGLGVNEGEGGGGNTNIVGVQTTSRTIAYGLFDISSPTFEDDVRTFLETHVNQCSPCSPDHTTIPPCEIPIMSTATPGDQGGGEQGGGDGSGQGGQSPEVPSPKATARNFYSN